MSNLLFCNYLSTYDFKMFILQLEEPLLCEINSLLINKNILLYINKYINILFIK